MNRQSGFASKSVLRTGVRATESGTIRLRGECTERKFRITAFIKANGDWAQYNHHICRPLYKRLDRAIEACKEYPKAFVQDDSARVVHIHGMKV